MTVSVDEKTIEKEPDEPDWMSGPPLENMGVAPHEPDQPDGAETDEQLQGEGMAISTSLTGQPPPLWTVQVIVLFVEPLGMVEGATVTE